MNATILTLLLLSAAPRGPVPSPKPVEYATLIDTDEDDSPKFELKVRDSDLSTLPDDTASLSVAWMQAVSAMGQGSTTNIEATYGLTDRLEIGLSTLALAYRYGEPGEGKVEWTPWVGLIEWNFMSAYSRLFFVGNLGAGLGARVWIDGRSSLVAQAAVYTPMASQVGSHWIIELKKVSPDFENSKKGVTRF